MTTTEYISPAESARLIRSELKTRYGWTSRQVSVKSESYSMGSSIDIKIKVPGISIAAVEEIASQQENIHRCEMTGEILGGGNRFVSVSLDWELVKREGAKLVGWVEETPIHPSQLRVVEVCGETYYIGRTHQEHGYSVRSVSSGFIPTSQTARGVAEFFARQMIQAGIEVVPPADPEDDGPELEPEALPITKYFWCNQMFQATGLRIFGARSDQSPTGSSPLLAWEPTGVFIWQQKKSETETPSAPPVASAPSASSAALVATTATAAIPLPDPEPVPVKSEEKLKDKWVQDKPTPDEWQDWQRYGQMPKGWTREDGKWKRIGTTVPESAPVKATSKEERKNTSVLLDSVKEADQDFEWYPTTRTMVERVNQCLDKGAESLLDIGAGDGRVLKQLSVGFIVPPKLYAIEKSTVLIQAQPEDVIPVGTDLFEQNLTALPVDYIFCNPPYSQFETWACLIIESGYARRAFLVLPQRWKDNPSIVLALKKREASARVIHSDDFFDAPRKARAVVDIVEITFPKDRWGDKPADPFDIWFDQNVSTFDEEQADNWATEQEAKNTELARIRGLDSITSMVEAYREEYARMESNYRAIFALDYALLRELGVNKENVREGIKKKMAGLKSKYWALLFERLESITNRLTAKTRTEFLEKLLGQAVLAFTESNAYAIVIWAVKNANLYFDQQTVALFLELSTFEGVFNYVSNVRTWKREDWRFSRRHYQDEGHKPTHYGLDYRIVLEKFGAIGSGWDYPNGLSKACHDTISDIVAVLFNLGFPAYGARSLDREWSAGEWQNWYRLGSRDEILFQAKAHVKGTLHFRFNQQAIKALNIEAGRLLGWLKDPGDVVEELGYTGEEARRWYGCTKAISTVNVQKLIGAGEDPPV